MTDSTEAIEILKDKIAPCVIGKWLDAVTLAVSALELQTPRKPVGTHYAHMRCPSCNHRIPSGAGSSSRRRDNWCNYCGQKIDWEVEA